MAKRFTDSEKWADPWFCGLPPKYKLVWLYLCDMCDTVGVWKVNLPMLEFQITGAFTPDELKEKFGRRLVWLSDEKVWLPGFIPFQYGTLNPHNKAHLGIMRKIISLTANLPLSGPAQDLVETFKTLDRGSSEGQVTPQVKEEVKEEVKEKNSSFERGVGKTFKPDLNAVYKLYPRKEGKSKGLSILSGSIKTPADLDDCFKAMAAFLAHHKKRGTAADFFPHFKTWAGSWRDWLDPDHGSSEDFSAGVGIDWSKFADPEGE